MLIGTTNKGEQVHSLLTDDEAAKLLASNPSTFARDLVAAYKAWGGRLSQGRRVWLHKLANEAASPKPEPAAAVELPRIRQMMEVSLGYLKAPKVVIAVPAADLAEGYRTVAFSIATSRAKVPGSITVTDGKPYGESQWYGRIVDGKWEPSRNTTSEVMAAIERIDLDPAKAASESGRILGRCCFCRQGLSDERSIAVGYGPVCASNYGLPWKPADVAAKVEAKVATAQDGDGTIDWRPADLLPEDYYAM